MYAFTPRDYLKVGKVTIMYFMFILDRGKCMHCPVIISEGLTVWYCLLINLEEEHC
jgi:hypothetical protein